MNNSNPFFKPNLSDAVLASRGEAVVGFKEMIGMFGPMGYMAGGGLVQDSRALKMILYMASKGAVPTESSLKRISRYAKREGSFGPLHEKQLEPSHIKAHFNKATNMMSREVATKTYSKVSPAIIHAKFTGVDPVVYNRWLIGWVGGNPFNLSGVTHERIHAAHYANKDNSFIKSEIAKTPSLGEIFNKKHSKPVAENMLNLYNENAKAMGPKRGPLSIESERLAWSNMGDPKWLERAEVAGVKTSRQASASLIEQVNMRRSKLGRKGFSSSMMSVENELRMATLGPVAAVAALGSVIGLSIMRKGQGNSNTSTQNRSMKNPAHGSKRMSSAL
jgi:hypothetical protein